MDESRQSSLSGASAALRKAAPPPALCGFVLLLVLIFAVSRSHPSPRAVSRSAG